MGFLFVLIVIAVFIGSFVWSTERSQKVLRNWADKNGHKIMAQEWRWLCRGPFWWRTSKGQEVFFVTVEDRSGNIRRGWVRCGSWFFGLFSDQATVEWESFRPVNRHVIVTSQSAAEGPVEQESPDEEKP